MSRDVEGHERGRRWALGALAKTLEAPLPPLSQPHVARLSGGNDGLDAIMRRVGAPLIRHLQP